MKFVSRHVLSASVLVLTACQMSSAQTIKPSVLMNTGAEVRQELKQAIVTLTGFSSVSLSDSDLTQSSELMIERNHQRDGNGELIQGRDLENAAAFSTHAAGWALLASASGKRQETTLETGSVQARLALTSVT